MGYAFLLLGAAISWSSVQQTCVTNSSTKAEYISFGHAGKEGVQQLDDLGIPRARTMTMYSDNQGAIAMTAKLASTTRRNTFAAPRTSR